LSFSRIRSANKRVKHSCQLNQCMKAFLFIATAPDNRLLIQLTYRSVEKEMEELSRIHNKPLTCTLQMQIREDHEDQAREVLRFVHKKLDRYFAQSFYHVTQDKAKQAIDEAISEVSREARHAVEFGHPPFVNDQDDQDEYENRIAEKYLGKGYVLDLNKALRK
jgi:hypothetical protein